MTILKYFEKKNGGLIEGKKLTWVLMVKGRGVTQKMAKL